MSPSSVRLAMTPPKGRAFLKPGAKLCFPEIAVTDDKPLIPVVAEAPQRLLLRLLQRGVCLLDGPPILIR